MLKANQSPIMIAESRHVIHSLVATTINVKHTNTVRNNRPVPSTSTMSLITLRSVRGFSDWASLVGSL